MSTQKKPSKKRKRLAGCPPHIDRLYSAVNKYVETGGGKILVIGGVDVQEWPQDNVGVFMVAIKCLGRKPSFPTSNGARS